MLKETVIENTEICKRCGGQCCKKSGCTYLPSNFESMKFEHLKYRLDQGEISIVTCFTVDMINNKPFVYPILSLRARNINRPIIDLMSKKTTCAQLTPTGCKYPIEDRPKEGAAQIPSKNRLCLNPFPQEYTLGEWKKHQKVLRRLVEHYSNRPFKQELLSQIDRVKRELAAEIIMTTDKSQLSEETKQLLIPINYMLKGSLVF